MTEPVDPQEQYLERLRAVFDEQYGTKYRPGLADTMASSDASMEDLQRIGALVRALDVQNRVRLESMSGVTGRTSGEENDLLNAVGAGHEARTARERDSDRDEDDAWYEKAAAWLLNVGDKDVIRWKDEESNSDAALQSPIGSIGRGLMKGLDWIGKVPGFIYRANNVEVGGVSWNDIGSKLGIPTNGVMNALGGDDEANRAEYERSLERTGYGTGIWDQVAFNWNQGEQNFRNLDPIRARFGESDVDLALEIFRQGGLDETRQRIQEQYAAGEITVEEASAKIQRIDDPEFVEGAYGAVDRNHVSPGRDLARALLPEAQEDDKWFTTVSGAGDTLFTLFADPLILGGEAIKGVQLARWGIQSATDTKIYTLLGEADPITGALPAPRYAEGSNKLRAGVQRFLDDRKAYDAAIREGRGDEAATIFAGAQQRHRTLMPLWGEVGGVRPAITVQEREAVQQLEQRAALSLAPAQPTLTDANGIVHAAVTTKPIETVAEFAEYAVNNFALMRLSNGMAASSRRIMPGKVGYWAEKRANRAMNRTMQGQSAARANGETLLDFGTERNVTRILGDEADDLMQESARLRGEELFDLADEAALNARKLRTKLDATSRRLSTFLPQSRSLRLNSAADAKIVEQFARIYMPKWEATRLAAMWSHASPAGRRTIAKAVLIQTFEASGLSRSAVGRELMDKYVNDLDKLSKRRYGYGQSDHVRESYRGEFRGGLYPSHVDDTITLPAFSELRQLAAKAAVLGYDPNMTKLGLDAASARALAMGKGRKIPRLGTTALRYMLFSSQGADRLMKLIKLGWITNPANMLRNAGDEVALINLAGEGAGRVRGRVMMSRAGEIGKRPVSMFAGRTRLLLTGRTVTEQDMSFYNELEDSAFGDEVREYLGGRYIDNADESSGLSTEYAREAAQNGVPVERFEYQGHKMVERDGDEGLRDLSNYYGQRFQPDSPAAKFLSYILWQESIENREFYEALTEQARETMQHHFPDVKLSGTPPEGALTPDEFAESGEELLHGTSAKFDTFSGDRNVGNTGRGIGDRVYFTDQPSVAENFAHAGNGKASMQLPDDFWQRVSDGDMPDVPEEAVARYNDVLDRIERGLIERPGTATPPVASKVVQPGLVPPAELLQGDVIKVRHSTSGAKDIDGDTAMLAKVDDPDGVEAKVLSVSEITEKAAKGQPDRKMTRLHLEGGGTITVRGNARAARTSVDQLSDLGSRPRWMQAIKLSQKGKLADQPAKREAAIKAFQAERDLGIDVNAPDVRALIDDTTRGSADRFSQWAHNKWVATNSAKKASGERLVTLTEREEAQWGVIRPILEKHLANGGTARFFPDGGTKGIDVRSTVDLDAIKARHHDYAVEAENWTFAAKNREARVIKAKVYGKTVDLRRKKYRYNETSGRYDIVFDRGGITSTSGTELPESLKEALEAKVGGWKPWKDNAGSNVYGHERSKELTDWMRANGVGKVIVDDAGESGLYSYIALPEMIAHGANDPVATYKAAMDEFADPIPPRPIDLVDELDDPRHKAWQEQLELYNIDDAGNRIAPDDVDGLMRARGAMIPRYLMDLKAGVSNADGEISPELASMLLRNEIPDEAALKAIGTDFLPPTAIKVQYGPASGGPVAGIMDRGAAVMTRWYDGIVTKPQRSLVRHPLFADAYVTARYQTDQMAKMLVEKHGWTKEVADDLAKSTAEKHALAHVIKYVDNPKVASQFSTMSRNWWTFARAQEDWLRRYGKAITADPMIIRKAQLGIIGAEHAGILDRDDDGNLKLTYPGSGAVVEALLHVGNFLGIRETAQVPHVPDMTTRLTFINPSLSNPTQYSATPLVSIPFKVIANLAPGGELLKERLDRQLNGELGAGREWWEQVLPTPVLRMIQLNTDPEDTGSFVGGAVATAMINMALNGTLENYADTPDDRARFIADLQTQTLNVLAVRGVFGLFAPGAPNMPALEADESGVASLSYQDAGIQTLKEEFNHMVATMGPGPAYSLWAELYPDASVFMDAARTEPSARSARTNPTMGSAEFIDRNREFFTGDYRTIAAYFLPEAPGEFNDVAWRTMTEIGVRQYRDTDELFMELVTANGTSKYYEQKDSYEAKIADAKLRNDRNAVAALEAEWKVEKADIFTRYPTLPEYLEAGTARKRERLQAVEKLAQLADDPDVPSEILPQLGGITEMVNVYYEFENRTAAIGSARNSSAQAEKQNLRAAYHDAMRTLIKRYPSLEDAYNGVFRSLVEQE